MNVHILKGSNSEINWMLCETRRWKSRRDVVLDEGEALQFSLLLERFSVRQPDQSNFDNEHNATLDVPARRVTCGK